MQVRYDQEADALSIRVLADAPISRTESIDSGTLVDLDRFGNVVSIEVIRPARNWPLDDIVGRYSIGEEALLMLRELWGHDQVFPFAEAVPA